MKKQLAIENKELQIKLAELKDLQKMESCNQNRLRILSIFMC